MYPSVYDLKDFYDTLTGRVIRRVVQRHVLDIWPESDCRGLRIAGCGYAVPYLGTYREAAERVFALMPGALGAHHWPRESKIKTRNLVCVHGEAELPLETNSVDRILVVHALEYTDAPGELFAELWRVLKSSGRLLVVVPNRMGLWARADWTPFGQGRPYSARQVETFLRESLFVHEETRRALFVPPFRRGLMLRSAQAFESVGAKLYPALGGLHVIEASKQLYAGTGLGAPVRARLATARLQPAAGVGK